MYIKAGETYTVSDERMSLGGMQWVHASGNIEEQIWNNYRHKLKNNTLKEMCSSQWILFFYEF